MGRVNLELITLRQGSDKPGARRTPRQTVERPERLRIRRPSAGHPLRRYRRRGLGLGTTRVWILQIIKPLCLEDRIPQLNTAGSGEEEEGRPLQAAERRHNSGEEETERLRPSGETRGHPLDPETRQHNSGEEEGHPLDPETPFRRPSAGRVREGHLSAAAPPPAVSGGARPAKRLHNRMCLEF
jgi:hypothetical protein